MPIATLPQFVTVQIKNISTYPEYPQGGVPKLLLFESHWYHTNDKTDTYIDTQK
jgi:hypothetical protein